MIKVIIVDDEAPARNVLEEMLTTFFPNKFEILSLCDSVDKAAISILEYPPQIVFLDVQMPNKNGFELLKMFPDRKFEVVFTTAHSEFALKAIKFSAMDYLLKPIDLRELRILVSKIDESTAFDIAPETTRVLLKNIENERPSLIAIPTERSIEILNVNEIMFCQASGSYVTLALQSGKTLLVSKSLKYFEYLFDTHGFIKTHKSYVVNTLFVQRYLKREDCFELNSGERIPVSARKKASMMEWIKNMKK